MNKQIRNFLFVIHVLFFSLTIAQTDQDVKEALTEDLLFSESTILPIKLSYSNKELKRETNDSILLATTIAYNDDSIWMDVEASIRARGNNRLENCHFAPVKIKFKKKKVKGTLFQGHKNLKLVLPCLLEKEKNDNVIKEYVAYRIFEKISPYYFRTRMVDIQFDELRNNKIRSYKLKGFLIEDDKHVAKRFNGKVYDRSVHPLNQDDVASVRQAMFQYLIGNTDFSQTYQHNVKIIFADEKLLPVPYDFDMSGLVNTSYAVVSSIQGEPIDLESVTERKYRGFARGSEVLYQVRQEFLEKQDEIKTCLIECENLFESEKEYRKAVEYVNSFYEVLNNEQKFRDEIVAKARTK